MAATKAGNRSSFAWALNRRHGRKRLLNLRFEDLCRLPQRSKAARGCPTRRIATIVYHTFAQKYTTFFVHISTAFRRDC